MSYGNMLGLVEFNLLGHSVYLRNLRVELFDYYNMLFHDLNSLADWDLSVYRFVKSVATRDGLLLSVANLQEKHVVWVIGYLGRTDDFERLKSLYHTTKRDLRISTVID